MGTHSSFRIARAAALVSLNIAVALTVHVAWSAWLPSAGAAQKAIAPLSEEERMIQVIAKASPAVVSILVQQEGQQTLTVSIGDDIKVAAPTRPLVEVGKGTGFIVTADGLIATNRHVAYSRSAILTVFLSDGRSFKARVADIDPVNDLALLKIEAKNLPTLALEADDAYRLGQTTIAIGNALGKYANTVTRGILSGVNREVEAENNVTGATERLEELLQTDAAINSGNSGGPLLNLDGKVIGMNTAVEHSGQGLGFAIPVSEIRKVTDSYRVYGAIARPRLGVRYFPITPEFQLEHKLAYSYGAFIGTDEPGQAVVLPNSPAGAVGLMAGDIILDVNGKKLEGKMTLAKAIQLLRVGDAVKMSVARGDVLLVLTARLDAQPPYAN
ncbi:MAG: trypsin-like peptidase domain-containing protein [Patescibacteria group bacterium]|jgi:S1-C subfamily serine protease